MRGKIPDIADSMETFSYVGRNFAGDLLNLIIKILALRSSFVSENHL